MEDTNKKKGINFYAKNGFLKIQVLFKLLCTHIWLFCVGGRNIGKTYSLLKTLLFGDEDAKVCRANIDFNREFPWGAKMLPFLWIRSTPDQYKGIANDTNHIFVKMLQEEGCGDVVIKAKELGTTYSGLYLCDKNEEGEWEINPDKPICYVSSLKSFSRLTGLDGIMSSINLVAYDEFIKTDAEDNMTNKFGKLKQMLATIDRNREMQGRPALRLVGLANANQLNNDIFEGLDVIDDTIAMSKKKQQYKAFGRFGIVLFYDSPISKRLKKTAMYELLEQLDDPYAKMAIDNEFEYDESELVESRSLKDCRPICSIDGLGFYACKKGDDEWVYVSRCIRGGKRFGKSLAEHRRFIGTFGWLDDVFIHSFMQFEDYTCKYRYHKIWDLKNWTND